MLRYTHDAQHTPCQHVRLARSGVGEICICPDCGVVHVALQYFTMRFELEAFKALQTMFSEAQSKIEVARQVQAAAAVGEPFAVVSGDGFYKAFVH
ncbi:MAG: hypothetical protein HYX43_03205 [Burkholderiales bacterium]|nr:hypothetical protein [Burkholderiales bacterium]